MALSLGLLQGAKLWFDDTMTEVVDVLTPTRFKLKVYGPGLHTVYEITNAEKTEILPDVLVSSGPSITPGGARIVIEAPRRIEILRDKVRRKQRMSQRT